jgi:phage tail-like protein
VSPAPDRPRHLRLDGRIGWRALSFAGAAIEAGTLVLAPEPGAGAPLDDPTGTFGGLAPPTGTAIAPDGTVYRLDPDTLRIERTDACGGRALLPALGGAGKEPRRLHDATGLAVSACDDLIICDTGNRRVQVVSLKGLTLRAVWGPLRLEGAGADRRAVACEADHPDAWQPWDAETAADGTVLVSDRRGGAVHRIARDGMWLGALTGAPGLAPPLQEPTHLAIDGTGRIYVRDLARPGVVVLEADGRFARVAARTTEVCARFCPWDPSCARDRLEREGHAVAGPLDSELPECVWDRIELDAELPPGTAIAAAATTSDVLLEAAEVAALPADRWRAVAELTRQEAPWDCLLTPPPGRFCWLRLSLRGDGVATPRIGAAKVHFPRRSSLRRLPAVYREEPASADFLDRFLSLFDRVWEGAVAAIAAVPALFDPGAAPAGDGPGPPSDALSWLASWLDLSLEEQWPVARRRELVRHAHRLYRLRGTPEGLRLHLEIATARRPWVLEHFTLRNWLYADGIRVGEARAWGSAATRRLQLGVHDRIGDFALTDAGDPLLDPFNRYAHQFTVFVVLPDAGESQTRRTVRRVVAMAQPAHAEGRVEFVRPLMRVGVQSFVGVDTVIGRWPALREGEHELGRDAVLGPSEDETRPPRMRVGVRSRIGTETVID